MKTLQVFFGVSVAVALLGASVAVAEIRNESMMEPLAFNVSTEDGSISMPNLKFDKVGSGGEEAQQTCAMTPGGTMPNLLMEMPVVPPVNPERAGVNQPERTPSLGIPPYNPSYPSRNQPYRPTYPPGTPENPPPPPEEPDDPPPVLVPEPATLVILGLGIGGAVVARRRYRKA